MHIHKGSRKQRLYQKLPHECSQHATPNWGKRQATPNSINQWKMDKIHIQQGILICHKRKKSRYTLQHQHWQYCTMENKLDTEGCVMIIFLWNAHKESDWLWADCNPSYCIIYGVYFGGGQYTVFSFFSSVKTFKQIQQIILTSVVIRTQQLNKSQWCII